MASYSTASIQSPAAASTHWVASQSRVMSTIERAIEEIAHTSSPILLVGPRGVGKHALAFRIYELSERVNGSFLELACETAAEDVFHPGSRYLTCDTLYLDGVRSLRTVHEDALLKLYFGREADWAQLPRLLASTTEDEYGVADHPFQRCLQSTIVLRLPELRERGRDVLALAEHFLNSYSDVFGRPKPELSEQVTQFFLEYRWPGNLDELEAACKTLVALGDGRAAVAALRASVLRPESGNGSARNTSLKEASRLASQQAERTLIIDVLQNTAGNRKQAARQLQISYKALLYKLKEISLSGAAVAEQEEGEQA